MRKGNLSSLLGGNDVKEPIKIMGINLNLKLLSVYEALICDSLSKELLKKMVKDGADRKTAEPIAENACLAYMCLYNRRNKKFFESGFEAANLLTSEELLKVAEEYINVKNSFLNFNNLTPKRALELKKN